MPSKRINPLQLINGNEVSALARLIFYENLLIGQEKSVCCPPLWLFFFKWVECKENVRAFFPQGQRKTVRNNEVSVLRGFDCILNINL